MRKKKNSVKGFLKKLTKVSRKRAPAHAYEKAVISWSAPEFEKFDKGTAWFVVAFMASGLLIYYGFANGAWSFSLAIIAAMIAYGVHLKQKPRKVKIKISKMGITLGKIKVPFSHMRTFWITYHPPFMKTLTIRTTDVWLSDLTIQLEDQDPVEIREFLVKQIPEWEGKQIGFFDSLARFFKL